MNTKKKPATHRTSQKEKIKNRQKKVMHPMFPKQTRKERQKQNLKSHQKKDKIRTMKEKQKDYERLVYKPRKHRMQ